MTLVLVAALLALAAAAVVAGRAVVAPAQARRQLLATVRAAYADDRQPQPAMGFRPRVLDPLLSTLADLALRLGRKSTLDEVRGRLHAAGLDGRISPAGFLAGKVLLAGAGAAAGALAGGLVGSGPRALLLAVVFVFGALFLPEFALSRRTALRTAKIDAELPKAIDLLAVAVEAGLGFDAALAKLLERFHGDLSDELALMQGEIRVGESRSGALRRLAERVPSPAVARFVQALVQGDQLGISLTRILRTQAEEMRNQQRAAAEERAMKAPIKMLFPTIVFIFPALFVVALGAPLLSLHASGF